MFDNNKFDLISYLQKLTTIVKKKNNKLKTVLLFFIQLVICNKIILSQLKMFSLNNLTSFNTYPNGCLTNNLK